MVKYVFVLNKNKMDISNIIIIESARGSNKDGRDVFREAG